jgi:hypothetical protein
MLHNFQGVDARHKAGHDESEIATAGITDAEKSFGGPQDNQALCSTMSAMARSLPHWCITAN